MTTKKAATPGAQEAASEAMETMAGVGKETLETVMKIGADAAAEGYRNVSIELWTHAIGGLSENDFILAAKIDQLPIQLKG